MTILTLSDLYSKYDAENANGDNFDYKGRPLASDMSDSDKLTEVVLTFRALADALEDLGNNPMLMALMPGGIRIK